MWFFGGSGWVGEAGRAGTGVIYLTIRATVGISLTNFK